MGVVGIGKKWMECSTYVRRCGCVMCVWCVIGVRCDGCRKCDGCGV